MTPWHFIAPMVMLTGCVPGCEPGFICVIAGTGELGFNGDGLPALETRLALPTSVGLDPAGRVAFADYSNMRVRVLDDGLVTTLVGNGTHAASEVGADRLDTPLENPIDFAWDSDGLLYVLPQHEARVIRVEADDSIGPWLGTGVIADNAEAVDRRAAEMGYGGGLAFAADGTLYVSDTTYSRVRRVSPEGAVQTVLGTGAAGAGEPGLGPQMAISGPERLVVDDERHRLVVADTKNHRVLSLDLDTLEVSELAGPDDLAFPVGVQVAPSGVVLVGDLGNDRIVAIDDGMVSVVAGGPLGSRTMVDRPPDFAMRGPAGLAWTPDGDLLIAARTGQQLLRWNGAADAL